MVLPPDPTAELRAAGESLLARLAERHDGLSTHLVVSAVSWNDVESPADLVARAREACDLVAAQPTWSTLFGDLLRATTPDLVVCPRADSDRFTVAVRAADLSLYSDEAVKLEYADWSSEDVVRRVGEEAGAEALQWVVLLVPHDADAACRRRCDALLAELVERGHASWAMVRRMTRAVSASDVVGPAALEEALPRIAAEPYQDPREERDR